MYNTNRTEQRVSVETRQIRQVHLSFSLGDLLPNGGRYVDSDDTDLVITLHYLDSAGRSRRKTWTIPSTDLEGTF